MQQEKKLNDLFEKAQLAAARGNGDIRAHFEFKALSDYEKAVCGYLRLIAVRSLPVSIIESPDFRAISRFEEPIGVPRFVEIIFKLVEFFEGRVIAELRETKGTILYDGWSSLLLFPPIELRSVL